MNKTTFRASDTSVANRRVFEARNRSNTFGRFVNETLKRAVEQESEQNATADCLTILESD